MKEQVIPVFAGFIIIFVFIGGITCITLYGLDRWKQAKESAPVIGDENIQKELQQIEMGILGQGAHLRVVEIGHCQYILGEGVIAHCGNCTNHMVQARTPVGQEWFPKTWGKP